MEDLSWPRCLINVRTGNRTHCPLGQKSDALPLRHRDISRDPRWWGLSLPCTSWCRLISTHLMFAKLAIHKLLNVTLKHSYFVPPTIYPLPLFPPQTDILCGFLIVIVSLYSIVFHLILSCILPHNCYRLVSACCCKPLLSDIIIIRILVVVVISISFSSRSARSFWMLPIHIDKQHLLTIYAQLSYFPIGPRTSGVSKGAYHVPLPKSVAGYATSYSRRIERNSYSCRVEVFETRRHSDDELHLTDWGSSSLRFISSCCSCVSMATMSSVSVFSSLACTFSCCCRSVTTQRVVHSLGIISRARQVYNCTKAMFAIILACVL